LFIDINHLKVNYTESGQGNPVVLLHGWGASIKSVEIVHNYLKNHFKVYSIDLPGFGQSEEPPSPWDLSNYSDLVLQFLTQLQIVSPILIGHSFGGRIIIKLAGEKQLAIKKIILVDSAGVKPKRTFKYYYKVYTYKLIKKTLQLPFVKPLTGNIIEKVKGKFGSSDYKNASDIMRQVMVKVVNEDLRHLLPKINRPTLLIWGENDQATPVSDGKMMEKLIPDAGLVIFKNAGHFSYLDQFNQFSIVIASFLKEDMGGRQ
jgi:pimeloyl-ACP methyl ester carboxylesterase